MHKFNLENLTPKNTFSTTEEKKIWNPAIWFTTRIQSRFTFSLPSCAFPHVSASFTKCSPVQRFSERLPDFYFLFLSLISFPALITTHSRSGKYCNCHQIFPPLSIPLSSTGIFILFYFITIFIISFGCPHHSWKVLARVLVPFFLPISFVLPRE